MSSFSIALSGLSADSAALDVVGNNLANLNTTGFKNSNVSFYDLLQTSVAGGSTQIGGGVSAPQTERIFNQGSIQLTGGNYDAAIKGNGFFVVKDPSGNTLYTRAGNFNLDANGNQEANVDFRAVYCSLIEQWFGDDAGAVIPEASGFGRPRLIR